jgi:hypothetical protein
VARAAAVLLLTLRGTPFLYYGEELGMGDVDIPAEESVDPPATRFGPDSGWWDRSQCRTPMPWSPGPGAGFTPGRPWLRLGRHDTATSDQPRSVTLSTYRPSALQQPPRRSMSGRFAHGCRRRRRRVHPRDPGRVVLALNFGRGSRPGAARVADEPGDASTKSRPSAGGKPRGTTLDLAPDRRGPRTHVTGAVIAPATMTADPPQQRQGAPRAA